MDALRTEEEQIEALRRWWQENGRSTLVTIVLVLGGFVAWEGWQGYRQQQAEGASELYQAMLENLSGDDADDGVAMQLADRLKSEFSGTTYAQFAALHRAAAAVREADLAAAEAELRWVLGRADKHSDTAQVAQLRLARVLTAAGQTDQALAILAGQAGQAYRAAREVARGDIYLVAGREDEAREAYLSARSLLAAGQLGVDLPSLRAKLESLTPIPARQLAGEDRQESAPQSPEAPDSMPSQDGEAAAADAAAAGQRGAP